MEMYALSYKLPSFLNVILPVMHIFRTFMIFSVVLFKHLYGISCVLSTILNALQILFHLILITTLGNSYYYYPFINENTEA